MTAPKINYLKDYKPSVFTIDSVFLDVDIFEDKTIISADLKISRRSQGSCLELSGENMKLLELKLDGKILEPNRFQLSNEKLVILDLASDAYLVQTKVEIDPKNNKALEGLYQSGQQYCTQCEPEGFRKITYFIDRPDVMARYRTKISADKSRYPYLLSNGNRTSQGDLPGNRHWVEWEDPFKKPSYLFALVAGDFDVARDHFITSSGRRVEIEVYVDKGNLHKTHHAVLSLKKAMKWDEDTFGLEYDLDIYMIVAVDSFNMGAMENKGLNIFNSTYTLADQKTATDLDFQNIEGVIGHEYFHNWTGNRVTCRDWFQLTLKEGLTVYRDQEFSSDMLSRAVKRLEDVRLMKEAQFAEDSGPLAHPIRPSSFIEINNFYTRTVYEKGSEVIRMIATLIGKEAFRKGMDKYFELNDGKAVTTEDFIHAMEIASGKSLAQFSNWYSRAGTAKLKISDSFSEGKFFVTIEQSYPHTAWKVSDENILSMPFRLGLLTNEGQKDITLELTKLKETFTFECSARPRLSLNRGFSAPVIIEHEYSVKDLFYLMGNDEDPYARYEATQKVYNLVFKNELNHYQTTGELMSGLNSEFKVAFGQLLKDEGIDSSFKSYLLDLPSEGSVSQDLDAPDFDSIQTVLAHFKLKIGHEFQEWFLEKHIELSKIKAFELTPRAYGERALKNKCLVYLVASKTESGLQALEHHYSKASNMTEEIAALSLYVYSGAGLEHPAIVKFYQKWKHDSLVMLKWFAAIAGNSPKQTALSTVVRLEEDPLFLKDVPNYLRSLYLVYAKSNLSSFHNKDGSGYRFLAERIKRIDSFNPQVASRMFQAFAMVNKVDGQRQVQMKDALKSVMESNPSRDTFEVISKYLSQ